MTTDVTRRRLLGGIAAAGSLGLAGCAGASEGETGFEGTLAVTDAHQYSSPGCRCCGQYGAYLREHLDGTLDERTPADVEGVKRRHGVPPDLESCHTTVLDGYVVEGHVPVAAIAKLFDEEPEIDGVALPGMPAGSPGMGGRKQGPFAVYTLGGERTGSVYVEL